MHVKGTVKLSTSNFNKENLRFCCEQCKSISQCKILGKNSAHSNNLPQAAKLEIWGWVENIVGTGESAVFYTPAKQMFYGVYWNQPDCPSMCQSICRSVCKFVSVCVQNTTFCQHTGGSIKSHSVTALGFSQNAF